MARCFTRRGALPSAALLMYVALMLVSGAASLNPTTVGGRFGQLTNLASAARPDGAPLEKFVVNLDDPPRLRWKNVMLGNKEGALSTMSYLFKSLPDGLHAEVDALMVDAEARFPEWAKEEMLGVADVLNVLYQVWLLSHFGSYISSSMAPKPIYYVISLDVQGLLASLQPRYGFSSQNMHLPKPRVR